MPLARTGATAWTYGRPRRRSFRSCLQRSNGVAHDSKAVVECCFELVDPPCKIGVVPDGVTFAHHAGVVREQTLRLLWIRRATSSGTHRECRLTPLTGKPMSHTHTRMRPGEPLEALDE